MLGHLCRCLEPRHFLQLFQDLENNFPIGYFSSNLCKWELQQRQANFDLPISRFSSNSFFPTRAVCFLVSSFYVARNKLSNQKHALSFQLETNHTRRFSPVPQISPCCPSCAKEKRSRVENANMCVWTMMRLVEMSLVYSVNFFHQINYKELFDSITILKATYIVM